MEKILLLSFIAIIFLVAWLYGAKHQVKPDKTFETIPESTPMVKLSRRDQVSGKRFKKIGQDMNKYVTARKEKHWMFVHELRLKGIHWTPFGEFWMTSQLARAHHCIQ